MLPEHWFRVRGTDGSKRWNPCFPIFEPEELLVPKGSNQCFPILDPVLGTGSSHWFQVLGTYRFSNIRTNAFQSWNRVSAVQDWNQCFRCSELGIPSFRNFRFRNAGTNALKFETAGSQFGETPVSKDWWVSSSSEFSVPKS